MDELDRKEVLDIFSRSWIGVLGLAHEGDADVVPVTFACEGERLYLQPRGRVEPGSERGTEKACLMVYETYGTDSEWAYVTAHGPLEGIEGEELGRVCREVFGEASGASHVEGRGVWMIELTDVEGYRSVPPPVEADEQMDVA